MSRPNDTQASVQVVVQDMSREDLVAAHTLLRNNLQHCDWVAQETGEWIAALARSALHRMALDPDALADVAELLGLIAERARYLFETVDGLASDCGCSAEADYASPGSHAAVRSALRRQWGQWVTQQALKPGDKP